MSKKTNNPFAPCTLTEEMQEAGIIMILNRLTSGAYTCVVNLESVDKESKTNYRKFDPKHAAKLFKAFKEACVSSPVLRFWKGVLGSVDGRHSTDVLLSKDYTVATAEVHFNCDDKKAAMIFYEKTMTRKRMDQWAAYNAALTARYKWAIKIEKALAKYELSIPAHEGCSIRKSDIRSFMPLIEAYNKNGSNLERFCCIVAGWKAGESHAVPHAAGRCEFLRGLLDFLQTHPAEDIDLLADYLTRETPDHYERQATKYGKARADRGEYCKAFNTQYSACVIKDIHKAA